MTISTVLNSIVVCISYHVSIWVRLWWFRVWTVNRTCSSTCIGVWCNTLSLLYFSFFCSIFLYFSFSVADDLYSGKGEVEYILVPLFYVLGSRKFGVRFAVPVQWLLFISTSNPCTYELRFIAADSLQKIMVLIIWPRFIYIFDLYFSM